jgi:hypothetical protein
MKTSRVAASVLFPRVTSPLGEVGLSGPGEGRRERVAELRGDDPEQRPLVHVDPSPADWPRFFAEAAHPRVDRARTPPALAAPYLSLLVG